MTKHSPQRLLRERLERLRRDDSGISIIEVLVAFIIFSIISIGVAQATLTVVRTSADQRSRTVALNLAASEIDSVRAIPVVANIEDAPDRTLQVDGITYTISRKAEWVSASGADLSCGIAESDVDFQLKRVNVAVTWNGKLPSTAPVTTDTLISPEAQRDAPTTGRILISVKRADGSPFSGVPVQLLNTVGGAPTTAPATDVDGCSYALNVTPGTYEISVQLTDHLDVKQNQRPTETIQILAGGTGTASFSYDRAMRVNMSYPVGGQSGVAYPSTLAWTIFNADGSISRTGRPGQISLYPTSRSYNFVAGDLVQPGESTNGCVSPDPVSWPQASLAGIGLKAGVRQDVTAATPGGLGAAAVNLGVAQVRISNSGSGSSRYLTATAVAPPIGSTAPACATGQTITFGNSFTRGSTVKLALPYGVWKITSARNASGTDTLIETTGRPLTNAYPQLTDSNIYVIDPRRP